MAESYVYAWSVAAGLLIALLVLTVWFWRYARQAKIKESRLRNRLEAAKVAANRVKSLFIANISHEIRTPLNAILGHAQLLHRDERLDPRQLGQLNHIIDASNQLSDLINDLLAISAISSDSMTLQKSNFDLAELLSGLAVIFEKRCINKGLLFQFYHCSPIEMLVYADQGKIRQVLVKLLGNAVKFTASGQIDLRVEQTPSGCHFCVRDTGPGLSPRQQKQIFDPFKKHRRETGIGISMSIAKYYIELMGGQLIIDSKPGEGASFSFELPLESAKGPINTRQLRSHQVKRLQAPYLDPDNPVRVMVVDENQQNRQILTAMLCDIGIAAIEAVDGREAYDILRHLPKSYMPALVFYDVAMPLQTDARRLARIYHDYAPSGMQFVVLAALAVQQEIAQYLQHDEQTPPFDNFIAKPYRFEAVYQQLQNLLQVDFDYVEVEDCIEEDSLNWIDCHINRSLYQDIKAAAEDYEISRLENILWQLHQRSPRQKPLCDHLFGYISQYDMEGLMTQLDQIKVIDG